MEQPTANLIPTDRKNILLVTGSAGFIGMHVALAAASAGHHVMGIDDLNDYYDVGLKLSRLQQQGIDTEKISETPFWGSRNIGFIKGGVDDDKLIEHIFRKNRITQVIHLAAQAGVRFSIENPRLYMRSNVDGFFNILEACRQHKIHRLLFASSSSVYGLNKHVPFGETDATDTPISLYAATKKANELMAHTYAHVYDLTITGFRFFTVYGPWDRPDMALHKFTKNILAEQPIDVYNNGEMQRDFTYVTDIVEGLMQSLNSPQSEPYELFNLGRGVSVELNDFIRCLEKHLGQKAIINNLPIQPGDLLRTIADTNKLRSATGYRPHIDVDEGIENYVKWYETYYGQNA